MHILILPAWYDQKGLYFRDQACALLKQGHTVGVLYSRIYTPIVNKAELKQPLFCGDDAGIFTIKSEIINPFPFFKVMQAMYHKRHVLKLYEQYIAERGRPDLVHVHSLVANAPVALDLIQTHRLPMVVTEHNSKYITGSYTRRQIKWAQKMRDHALACIAVSQTLRDSLTKSGLGKQWEVIPNVLGEEFSMAEIQREPNTSSFTFVHVGHHVSIKNVSLLLHAFAKHRQLASESRLELIGHGPLSDTLKGECVSLGIEGHVLFCGELPRVELIKRLSKAHALVVSSYVETFSVVIIEAHALGIPVISTPCGGPEELITEENGMITKDFSVDAMFEALTGMQTNYSVFDLTSIRNQALSRYSSTVISSQLTHLYARALGQTRHAP